MTEYVAMGSSFGAGPGLRPRASGSPRKAGRSEANYAHLLAASLDMDLKDVTFSGATVAQLVNGGPNRSAPQTLGVDESTSLVTITAGGNDVGYLPALTLGSLPRALKRSPSVRRRLDNYLDSNRLDDRFHQLEQDLGLLIQEIKSRSPASQVILVGYLSILPPAGEPSPPLGVEIGDWGRGVAVRLATTMSQVSETNGALFIDVGAASASHHAWSEFPWTRSFHYSLHEGAPYHPTLLGMKEVADLVSLSVRRNSTQ